MSKWLRDFNKRWEPKDWGNRWTLNGRPYYGSEATYRAISARARAEYVAKYGEGEYFSLRDNITIKPLTIAAQNVGRKVLPAWRNYKSYQTELYKSEDMHKNLYLRHYKMGPFQFNKKDLEIAAGVIGGAALITAAVVLAPEIGAEVATDMIVEDVVGDTVEETVDRQVARAILKRSAEEDPEDALEDVDDDAHIRKARAVDDDPEQGTLRERMFKKYPQYLGHVKL